MNTANLQIKGIVLAESSLLEAMARAERKARDELSKSNVEASCLPIRPLREAKFGFEPRRSS